MSLINDALKKAQRQRAEGTGQPEPVQVEGTPASTQRIARREKPPGFQSQMMVAVGGGAAVVVLLLVVGGIWYWRSNAKNSEPAPKVETAATRPAPNSAATPVSPNSTPANPPPQTVTVAQAQPIAPPAAAPVIPHPAPAIEAKAPPVVAATPEPARTPPASASVGSSGAVQFTLPLSAPAAATTTADQSSAPSLTLPPLSEKAPERPKASLHMITIIEGLRVAGIRAAGEDSKVLMNDRVYRLNDIVDHDLGIKLTGVNAKSLTFEDDHGAVYTRNF